MLRCTPLKFHLLPAAPRKKPLQTPRPKEEVRLLGLGRGRGCGRRAVTPKFDGRSFEEMTPDTAPIASSSLRGFTSPSEGETVSFSHSMGTTPPSHVCARLEERHSPQFFSLPVPLKQASSPSAWTISPVAEVISPVSPVAETISPAENPLFDIATCTEYCIIVKGFSPTTERSKVLDIIRRASSFNVPRLVGFHKADSGSLSFVIDLLERKRNR